MRKRLFVLAAFVAAVAAAGALPAGADNDSGFHTSVPAMVTPLAPGGDVKPIISVGDSVRGYRFEAIPDGISFTLNGRGTMDVYVNHETSLVPFPATRSDFTNSLVSKLRLNQHSAGVLRGDYVIGNDSNYQRFCSNFLVGEEQGFERELLLTNEEARDIVLREGYAWHPPSVSLDEPFAEQAGVVVALDIEERRAPVDLRHGPAQPRERRRPRGLRPPGRALGRRHVRRAGVPDVHVLGRERLGALERRGDALRVRRGQPERQRLRRLPGRERRVRALRRGAADDRVGQEAGRY